MRKFTRLLTCLLLLSGIVACKNMTNNTNQQTESTVTLNEADLASFSFNIDFTDSTDINLHRDDYITKEIESTLNKLLPYLREKRGLVNGNIADIYFACDSVNHRFYVQKASIYRIQTSTSEEEQSPRLATASGNIACDNPGKCTAREIRENITDINSLATMIKKGCEQNETGLANITLLYSYR